MVMNIEFNIRYPIFHNEVIMTIKDYLSMLPLNANSQNMFSNVFFIERIIQQEN